MRQRSSHKRRRAQNRDNENQKERKRKANTTPAKETADTPPTEANTVHPHNKTEKTRDDTVHGNPREERVDDTTNVKQPVRAGAVSRKKRKKTPPDERKKKYPVPFFSAAMRPRKREEGTFYLKDLQILCAEPNAQRPSRCVECVNHFKEDIFGLGGENLNMGFPGLCAFYLVPIWTTEREAAKVTGFELVVSPVEDPSRQNLYLGIPGRFVYLVPTFDPSTEGRIIGLQLYRSRKFNPPAFGWSNTTQNINGGRGGDHLCLQWDLGTEQDIPGHRFRFRFWRR